MTKRFVKVDPAEFQGNLNLVKSLHSFKVSISEYKVAYESMKKRKPDDQINYEQRYLYFYDKNNKNYSKTII